MSAHSGTAPEKTLALVTGGARGLGRGIARRLAQAGHVVAIFDVEHGPGEGDFLPDYSLSVDVRDEASVERALDRLPALPEVVVNNAGVVRFGPLLDHSVAAWREVLDINLTGTFVVARAVARRAHAASDGRARAIVNVASINGGVSPAQNSGAYGPSKAAVVLLTQQMAMEWAPLGFRVNAVAPGLIDSGMSAAIHADPEMREARQGKVPLGRLGREEDVAEAVAFLASPCASYVTGQLLVCDGGVTLNMLSQLPRPRAIEGARGPR